MTRRAKVWTIAAAVLLLYAVAAIVAGRIIHPTGRDAWVLRGGLALLGLISAGLILWFFRDRTPAGPATPEARLAAEVDQVLTTARAQLAQAKTIETKDPRLASLPVVLVLGATGSTKTTVIARSGLEPELLGGEAMRGETVAPTKTATVWLAHGVVFAEAGGPVLATSDNWRRFVRALRPRTFVAALTGKPQASRQAVVCFACDELMKAGNPEAVTAAARTLRDRLSEAATELGVQLPTYVLFTKADAIPHFEAYVRNFSADEAREPLGAAIEADTAGEGTYAERVTPRLEQSMQEIYRSLAARRLRVLSREHAVEYKPPAYEFPREVRKLAPLVVEFLREIGKPSALRGSAVLRGFYFTGVQPVFVTDSTPEYTPAMQQPVREVVGARSATGVFSAQQMAAASGSLISGPSAPRTRKVPRWDFLPRLFREVILADDAAMLFTQGGERVGLLRRVALVSGAAVALLTSTAFAISYSGNRDLQREVSDAARGIAAIAPNNVDLPPLDAMQRLDSLRAQIDTLSAYEHHGAPLSLRWGLYAGSSIYQPARVAYFAAFNRLLFANTRASLVRSLISLPDSARSGDDFGSSYNLLKAYIVTTTHPEKSTLDLSPVLLKQWLGQRTIDSTRMQIAQRQFDTYARELQFSNPLPERANEAAVARGRAFLRGFNGSERIYQFMLAEAEKKTQPVLFNRRYPAMAAFVTDAYQVPGAFTKAGFRFMQEEAFKTRVDQFLQGESWVVGEGAPTVDRAKLVATLRNQYAAEYTEHWRRFLRAASVVRYSSVKDASQRLQALSGTQSALLKLLSITSWNTSVSPDIAAVFQPVQLLTPATDTNSLIGAGNKPYMTALLDFQNKVDQVTIAVGPGVQGAADQARQSGGNAKSAVLQMATTFTPDPQGHVQETVQNLLQQPITNAEPLLTHVGSDQINRRVALFCGGARSTLSKFPFNPNSTDQVQIQELVSMLRPGTGSLWTMYGDQLQSVLQKQGSSYQAVPGDVRLSPAFVDMFNKLATFSDVLFAQNPQEPKLTLTVKPIYASVGDAVTIRVEGIDIRASRNGNSLQQTIEWPSVSHETRLSEQITGYDATFGGPFNSLWALFQLFYGADSWQQINPTTMRADFVARSGAQATTSNGGNQLRVSVNVGPIAVAQLLHRSYFAGISCPSEPAR
jgi:type VI secretion system protein ImpL